MPAIRPFLESLNVYEADALRAGIAIADGRTTAANISADDRLALNRYLNSGKDNERMTADNAQGTSAEPCVSTTGACGGVLRQAATGHGKQAVAIHRRGRGGHQPCRFIP